ncbi:hypothetical protein [Xanthomonas albilineans]|uniref:hypothetical protein n=1 Tax=Xanthomonas albilineans TaxID=29447 RepID=UPI000A8BE199|nr:hypothetical protein [Xanthomonas albilineans]
MNYKNKKTNRKKLIFSYFVETLVPICFIYLFFSFVFFTFDVCEWSLSGRGLAALATVAWLIFVTIAFAIAAEERKRI